jgi:hypothetical protein
MRRLCLISLVMACAPANYYYNFDITDPGAQNNTKPGQSDSLEDSDMKAEILVDPTSFQAVLLNITNKTDQVLGVAWDQVTMINPDGVASPIKPDGQLGWVQPGTKVVARLVPFSLPSQGPAASAYDGSKFVLDVPMVVRGVSKDVRFHLVAQAIKQ